MARIIIVWGLWGPYHCRRFEALRDLAGAEGHEVTGVSLFSGSSDYQWTSGNLPAGAVHFDLGKDETRFPLGKLGSLLAVPWKLRPDVALLPSYDHWSLTLNAATRLAAGRLVMMNDTHAGTARARGLKAAFKQRIVAGFHAGFVAGSPQRRYFASLGLPEEKIFTGYDAVDNDYFASKSDEIRNRKSQVRKQYGLPEHYFLSLGRFVAKKNLLVLIRAYRQLLDSNPFCHTHLVMVGSGEEESKMRALCEELRLPVYQKTSAGNENGTPLSQDDAPGVHFYGFRQIGENPVFYALADAFVLPSLWEEWGLVVNEAMASGLPVVVSETAGCAEDLLPAGRPAGFETLNLATSNDQRAPNLFVEGIRQNGFVFHPKSPETLAAALGALASTPALRVVMGENSRKIVDHFSCENFAKNALLAARVAMGESLAAPCNAEPAKEAMGLDSKLFS
jgi:glycosyltransferase involved in cell wall biosynthesis